MAAHQLVCYNAPILNSSDANQPGYAVERDSQGNSSHNKLTIADVNATGCMELAGAAVTTSQTVDASAIMWEVDATAGAVVLTLPPVATVPGRVYMLKKVDSSANAAQWKGSGSENIDGANTLQTTTQWAVLRIRANAAGTRWLTW